MEEKEFGLADSTRAFPMMLTVVDPVCSTLQVLGLGRLVVGKVMVG